MASKFFEEYPNLKKKDIGDNTFGAIGLFLCYGRSGNRRDGGIFGTSL